MIFTYNLSYFLRPFAFDLPESGRRRDTCDDAFEAYCHTPFLPQLAC